MAASRQASGSRPVVAPGQWFTVREGRPGEVLGTIRATDGDGYWQVTGGTGADIFLVGTVTGQVILADPIPLHRSGNSTYTLTVVVDDHEVTSHEETVTITAHG